MTRMKVPALTVGIVLAWMSAAAERRPYYSIAMDPLTGRIFAAGGPSTAAKTLVVFTPNGRYDDVREILKTEGDLIALAINKSSGRLAVRERLVQLPVPADRANFRQGQRFGYERSTLHVLTGEGIRLTEVPQVREFAWRRSGTHLVVAVGEYQGHDIDPAISAVEIVDVASGSRRKISSVGNYVQWADFDDAVYLWDTSPVAKAFGKATVSRYNVTTGILEPSAHHSIYFSPTGAYYFKPSGIAGKPGVYRRVNDSNVTSESRVFAEIVAYNPESWAPEANVLMLSAALKNGRAVRLLYNVDSDTALEVKREDVVGWGRNATEVISINPHGVVVSAASAVFPER